MQETAKHPRFSVEQTKEYGRTMATSLLQSVDTGSSTQMANQLDIAEQTGVHLLAMLAYNYERQSNMSTIEAIMHVKELIEEELEFIKTQEVEFREVKE